MRWFIFCLCITIGSAYCIRNPFVPPAQHADHKPFRLTGIVKSKNSDAGILDDGKETYIVFKGSKINNYTITYIANDYLIISKDNFTQKLTLE